MRMNSSRKPRVFYGYWVLLAIFFCVLIYSGIGYYAFSLFVRPLQADFGWGRGQIMLGMTIFFLIHGVAAPFIGRVVDRYGARNVFAIGAFSVGLSLALLSQVHNLWQFYGGYMLLGIAGTGIGTVPASAVVSYWFKKRRGMAVGIMGVGIGVGGIVAPLVGAYLIPNFGWRTSYLVLALLALALVPLVLLVIKTKPADMGLHPDGMETSNAFTEAKAPPSTINGLTPKMALTTSSFWLITFGLLTLSISRDGTAQSQAPYLEDIGFPVAIASSALGIIGLGSAFGKFGFGWLCDWILPKYAGSIGLVLQAIGIVILISLKPASPVIVMWLYAIVFGLSMGAWVPTMAMLVSTSFGLRSFGTILGMIVLAQNVGSAAGPFIAGYMYDAMETYHGTYIMFLALCAVTAGALLAVRRPKYWKQ